MDHPERRRAAETSISEPPHESETWQPDHTTPRPAKKWVRVLAALVRGDSLNRFYAEDHLHDHCLPSTISELSRKGIRIDRRDEVVPGYRGAPAYVTRYWLDPDDPENVARARALLAGEWQEWGGR